MKDIVYINDMAEFLVLQVKDRKPHNGVIYSSAFPSVRNIDLFDVKTSNKFDIMLIGSNSDLCHWFNTILVVKVIIVLEAMIEIGDILLRDSNIIKESIKKVSIRTKQQKKRYVIKINFDLGKEKITFDIEEMDENSVEKYLHFGHQGAANKLQWYVTYEKCNNLISQSLPNLIEELEDSELKHLIEQVLQTFFIDHGEDKNIRYRYMMDIDRYFTKTLSEIKGDINEDSNDNKDKELLKAVTNMVTKFFAEEFDIKTDQIGLFTLCVNGKAIAQEKTYLELIEKSMQKQEGKVTKTTIICSVCGSKDNCTSKIDILTKFYTTNLHIFANNMNKKNYDKNLLLCDKCHNKFKAASVFMENDLRTKIAGLDVYIIPHVVYGKNLNANRVKQMAEIINPISGSGEALTTVPEYRSEVERRLAYLNKENFVFLLNIMFYRKLHASTKIQKLIQDIDPSVFSVLSDAFYDSLNVFYKHYPEAVVDNLSKRANLKFIYFMHPIKLKEGSPAQFQNVLRTYDNILNQKTLRSEVIFKNLADILTIIWREKEGYNVSFVKTQTTRQRAFDFKVLDCSYYIYFLERFGSLKGGEGMNVERLNLNSGILSYIKEMGYNEQQTSLFLLGVLVGAIGGEQSKRQYERELEGTYKPILNKINFNGMDKYRIMKLSNQIPSKLRHEKIQQYYEGLFSAHKYLLDKNIQSWKLNKDESLFYLLSGYGYQTMKKKTEKVNDEGVVNDDQE